MRCLIAGRNTKGRFYCTRMDGHEGPCAAVPIEESLQPWERLRRGLKVRLSWDYPDFVITEVVRVDGKIQSVRLEPLE